jgi:hypothetical protein
MDRDGGQGEYKSAHRSTIQAKTARRRMAATPNHVEIVAADWPSPSLF